MNDPARCYHTLEAFYDADGNLGHRCDGCHILIDLTYPATTTPAGTLPGMTDDPERVTLTYDQAVALLPDGDTIHTYMDSGIALVGADWTRDSVLKLLATGRPELSGPAATAMKHGIVAWRPDGEHVFIETSTGATT